MIVLAVEQATGEELETGSEPFSDVRPGQALYEYVVKAYKAGYIKGYPDGTFGYNKAISRMEAAAILQRALNLPLKAENFKDVPDNSAFAKQIGAVAAAGIMVGYGDNFKPAENLSRGQAAAVAYRALEYLVSQQPEEEPYEVVAVEQASDSSLRVKFNKAVEDTSAVQFEVKRDGQAVQVTPEWAQDKTSVELKVQGELQPGTYTVTVSGLKFAEGKNTGSVTVQPKEPAKPAVESATVANAKQIVVVFNKAVDKTSAEDEANYSIKKASDTARALNDPNNQGYKGSAVLGADGRTVTITLDNALNASPWSMNQGDAFVFTVKGIKDTKGNVMDDASVTLVYRDTTGPKLISASAVARTSTNTVVLTFSEPVNVSTGVFQVNGSVVSANPGDAPTEVKLSTQSLAAGSTNTVSVVNLKDYAGNLIEPNPSTLTFTVASDTAAAGIKSVSVDGDDTIRVEFAEAMDSSTVNTTNVKVLDANANAVTGVTINQVNSSVYTLLIRNSSLFANSDTVTLSLVFTSGVKDAAGNALSPTTLTVTLSKDTVKPTIQSVRFVVPNGSYDGTGFTNGAFVVDLSEPVAQPSGNQLDRAKLVVIDQNGQDITDDIFTSPTITNVRRKSDDASIVIIPLAAAPATTVESVTIRFAAGTFVDDSNGANGNEAKVVSGVSIKNGIGAPGDQTKPALSYGGATLDPVSRENRITYTINETNLDVATVLDINNYRLDGKPLPGDAYVTIAGSAPSYTATIHLPKNTVAETRTNYALTVFGIKDKAGNVADTLAVNSVSLTDNTDPKLVSGKINSDGTITLTFSEKVRFTTGATVDEKADDFVVKLNGKQLASEPSVLEITEITEGSDAGGFLVKIKVAVYDNGTPGDTTDDITYVDVDGSDNYDPNVDLKLAQGVSYGTWVRASDISSLSVTTASSGLHTEDLAGNLLVGGTSITIR